MKPTRILSEPTKILTLGRWRMLIITDAGAMTLPDAARAAGIERFTLNYRLRSHSKAWADPDIFAVGRQKDGKWKIPQLAEQAQRIADGEEDDDAKLIAQGRRDPLTVKLGSWERRNMRKNMTDEEREARDRQKRLAQKRRDDEYRDHLKHHRAMRR